MINQVNFSRQGIKSISSKGFNNQQKVDKVPDFKLNLVQSNPISDDAIDLISDKLENGNFGAVEELEKAGISYSAEERDNGYKVKFEIGDTKYTINYIDSSYNKFNPPNIEKPQVIEKPNNLTKDYSNDLQDLITKSMEELQGKLLEMSVPEAPTMNEYNSFEDYQKALDDYYLATEKYNDTISSYNDIISDLAVANSISKEQERLKQFDNQVKNVIESIKLDKSETNKEEKFKNVLDYAKDFKVKVDEKINCEKELNDCTDALSLLKVPNPPNVSDMSEIEYEKQYDIYTKLFEQYSREKEILEKREEMLSRKLDLYNALLDSMFLYDV